MTEDEFRAALAARDLQIARLTEAVARLTDLLTKQQPAAPSIPQVTVRELFEAFERAHQRAHSWRVARNRLVAFVEEFGDRAAMSITPAMWAAFREKRKAAPSRKVIARLGAEPATLSPLTINFELNWVKRMYYWAGEPEQALIPSNPLARVKREKVESERDTWLTWAEIDKLLRHFAGHPVMRTWLLVAVTTGLRISECLRIRRDMIRRGKDEQGRDVGRGELGRRRNKTRKPYEFVLPPVTMAALDALPPNVNPYLFPSPKKAGRPYGARHITRLFREGCEATGVDSRAADGDLRIRAHDLRHTAATLALDAGASLVQVQRMLNHTSLTHTERYVHMSEDDATKIASIVQGAAESARRGPQSNAPLATLETKARATVD